MTEIENNILENIESEIQMNNISNAFLVKLIELGGDYLNLKTIPDSASYNGVSYNGVLSCKDRYPVKLFNVTFVVDNK